MHIISEIVMHAQSLTSQRNCKQLVEILEGRVLLSTTVTFGHPISTSLTSLPEIETGGQVANFNGKKDFLLPIAIPVKGSVTDNNGSILLQNKGNNTFSQTSGPVATGGKTFLGVAPIAVGDFNGDHKQDFVYVIRNQLGSASTPLKLLFEMGKGNGTFTAGKTSNVTGSNTRLEPFITTGDFNHDNKLDVAIFVGDGSSSNVFVMYGNGDGTFKTQKLSFTGPSFASNTVQAIFAPDFNNDGKPDLVIFAKNEVSTFLNTGVSNGVAQFKVIEDNVVTRPAGMFDAQSPTPFIADFNGDKKPDLAILSAPVNGSASTNGAMQIFFGTGAGKFTIGPETLNKAFAETNPAVGDFNGDGKQDVATPGGLFLGKGNGTFNAPITTNLPAVQSNQGLPFFSATDINGDGVLDLVAIYTTFNFKTGATTAVTVNVVLAKRSA